MTAVSPSRRTSIIDDLTAGYDVRTTATRRRVSEVTVRGIAEDAAIEIFQAAGRWVPHGGIHRWVPSPCPGARLVVADERVQRARRRPGRRVA